MSGWPCSPPTSSPAPRLQRPKAPKLARLSIVVIVILAAACAGPRASPSAAPVGLYDVGGHSLYLECEGSGSPTIVYLHGIGGNRSNGNFLLKAFSSSRRVCTYDRVNEGDSDHVTDPQTASRAVADLHALLAAAGVRPPYLLVAASFGGLIGITYTSTYPSEVVGMVMLDASLPADAEIDKILPEPDRTEVTKEFAVQGEVFEYSTLAEAGRALDRMPDIPVTYLGATQFAAVPPNWPADQIIALTKQHWHEFVARFTKGRLVEVDSPHFPMPDAVVNAEIDRMFSLLGS